MKTKPLEFSLGIMLLFTSGLSFGQIDLRAGLGMIYTKFAIGYGPVSLEYTRDWGLETDRSNGLTTTMMSRYLLTGRLFDFDLPMISQPITGYMSLGYAEISKTSGNLSCDGCESNIKAWLWTKGTDVTVGLEMEAVEGIVLSVDLFSYLITRHEHFFIGSGSAAANDEQQQELKETLRLDQFYRVFGPMISIRWLI